jgi:hypothetical protein
LLQVAELQKPTSPIPELEELPAGITAHVPKLDALPTELVQSIAAQLLPASAASFALCNKLTLSKIGSHCFLKLRASLDKRSFLGLLEKDLPDRILCHYCDFLHHPSKLKRMADPQHRLDDCARSSRENWNFYQLDSAWDPTMLFASTSSGARKRVIWANVKSARGA